MSLHNAAWDMLHAVEAADSAGELADNIGGELIDALRSELDKPPEAHADPLTPSGLEALRALADRLEIWFKGANLDQYSQGERAGKKEVAGVIRDIIRAEVERSETPNAVTRKAMAETENGAVVNHASVTEMLADLDAPEERGKAEAGEVPCCCVDEFGRHEPSCPTLHPASEVLDNMDAAAEWRGAWQCGTCDQTVYSKPVEPHNYHSFAPATRGHWLKCEGTFKPWERRAKPSLAIRADGALRELLTRIKGLSAALEKAHPSIAKEVRDLTGGLALASAPSEGVRE